MLPLVKSKNQNLIFKHFSRGVGGVMCNSSAMVSSFLHFNNVNNNHEQQQQNVKFKKTTKSSHTTRSRSAAAGSTNILTPHVCWCLTFLSCFAFSAASFAAAPTPSPAVPVRIKPYSLPPDPLTQSHTRIHNLILIVSVLSVAATAVVVMGCFMLPRMFSAKRGSKRVEDAEMDLPPVAMDLEVKKEDKIEMVSATLSVKKFSWDEIVGMSNNFATMIGQGGFSTVYLGRLSDSSLGAVKVHPRTPRFNKIFKQELDILLHLQHDNIVQILGYSDEDEYGEDDMGGALVFEYIPNGNLQEKLHGSRGALSWKSRMWIAFQLAKAIEYLHHNCSLPIVHGDIKAANVLLDDKLNCKLCDFGSAKRGFSATLLPASNRSSLTGSPGYVDPHYLKTGTASKKNDVYSFGVIILELITGREAFCPTSNQCLATVAGPLLRECDVDPQPLMVENLNLNQSDLAEVMAMASLAAQCLHQQPSLRPSMVDILKTMTDKLTSIQQHSGSN